MYELTLYVWNVVSEEWEIRLANHNPDLVIDIVEGWAVEYGDTTHKIEMVFRK